MRNSIIFLIMLFCGIFSSTGQQMLSGNVCDGQSGKSIENATIKIINTNLFTTSDENGDFTITLPDKEILILKISHIGYILKNDTVNIKSLGTNIRIVLQPCSKFLNEVEITDSFQQNEPYIVNTLKSGKIKETPVFDVGTLIKCEPNVSGIKKGALGIDPVIRGFKYSQVAVQIDGSTKIEGGCPNRMDPTASHVNINEIKEIEILKGPFALKYGPNFGGFVNIEKYNPVFNSVYQNNVSMIVSGQTNHEGYKSGIRVYGGNSKIAYNLSANKSTYGDYLSGDGELISASSNNYNYDAGISIKPFSNQIISINYDRSFGRNVDYAALPMDERTDDTEVTQFNWFLSPKSSSLKWAKISAYNSDVKHVMDNKNRPFSDTVVAVSDIHAINRGARLSLGINTLGGILETGISYEHIFKDGNRTKSMIIQPLLPSFSEIIWNNAYIDNTGLFAEYRKNKGNIDYILSGRLDYNEANSDSLTRYKINGSVVYYNNDTKSEYMNFSISAGLTWHFTTKSSLFASVGSGTRSPDMTERFIVLLPVGYDSYDYLGNPQLKPETNHELDLGYNYSCSNSGKLTTSIFFSYVTNYISATLIPPSEIKPQTRGTLGVKQFTNIDKAYLTGFELSYTTPENKPYKLRLTTAYTAGINPEATVYVFDNDGNLSETKTVKNDPLPEIPPLEANLWIGYGFLNNKIVPELHFRAVAAQNQISQAYGENITPGFFLTNLNILYNYNSNMTVSAGINNIFNLNYYEHLNRRIIGSNTPFYEPGRLIYANIILTL